MSSPLVSVITTAYNASRFIGESMRSIFNQSFKDFELVVFNDSSTDRTWSIVEDTIREFEGRYSISNRIVGFGNIGCGLGRMEAISRASGKYIAIQDADDISYLNRLEKEVSFLESHDDIFCVGSWADKINKKGENIGEMTYPPELHNDIVDFIFTKRNPIIDPSSMFRRDVFDSLGGYEDKWNLVPDLHLWIKALKGGSRFANIPEKLICYRKYEESVTTMNNKAAVAQHCLLHKEMLSMHKKRDFEFIN